MAFSRTLWSYATIAEVYTLNTLLIVTVFFLMLRWRRRIVADQGDTGAAITPHDRLLYAAALVFGLGLGVHHVTVGLTLPAVAVIVYSSRAEIFHRPTTGICGADFDCRPGRCLRLFAFCSLAIPDHELGQSAFTARDLVACNRPPIPRVPTFSPSMMGTQFFGFAECSCANSDRRGFLFPCFGLCRVAERFQAGPHNFLVSVLYRDGRFGLRPQLRNCGGQRRLLFT